MPPQWVDKTFTFGAESKDERRRRVRTRSCLSRDRPCAFAILLICSPPAQKEARRLAKAQGIAGMTPINTSLPSYTPTPGPATATPTTTTPTNQVPPRARGNTPHPTTPTIASAPPPRGIKREHEDSSQPVTPSGSAATGVPPLHQHPIANGVPPPASSRPVHVNGAMAQPVAAPPASGRMGSEGARPRPRKKQRLVSPAILFGRVLFATFLSVYGGLTLRVLCMLWV
jgi:hypothetical protein